MLYLTDTVDSFMLMNLSEYGGKPLRNVDDASLELPELAPEPDSSQAALEDDTFEAVRGRFAAVLGERVLEVRESHMLTENPLRLVTPEGQPDRNVQRVYRMLEQDFEVPRKILELNRRHPLIADLAGRLGADQDAALVDEVIEQLYENALLADGIHPNPASMVGRIQRLLEIATRRAE